MNKWRVQEAIQSYLADLDSFLKHGREWSFEDGETQINEPFRNALSSFLSISLESTETFLGLYINALSESEIDCICVSNLGLHCIEARKSKFISFDSIFTAELPGDDDEDIDIVLKNGDCVSISVRGKSAGEPDIFDMLDFLTDLTGIQNRISLKPDEIDSREELIEYMNQNWIDAEEADSGPSRWLKSADLVAELKDLNIDPGILEMKGVWRLFALLLTLRP